jgi:hypothetical protein
MGAATEVEELALAIGADDGVVGRSRMSSTL